MLVVYALPLQDLNILMLQCLNVCCYVPTQLPPVCLPGAIPRGAFRDKEPREGPYPPDHPANPDDTTFTAPPLNTPQNMTNRNNLPGGGKWTVDENSCCGHWCMSLWHYHVTCCTAGCHKTALYQRLRLGVISYEAGVAYCNHCFVR